MGIRVMPADSRAPESTKIRILLEADGDAAVFLKKIMKSDECGCFSDNMSLYEFVTAIRTFINGEEYIRTGFKEKNEKEGIRKLKLLTDRETEVLLQVSKGKLNKEIADLLKISERTVKNHLSSIFRKLEVSDRTQAAVFAIRSHMIEIK